MTRLLLVTYPWNMTLLHLVDCLFWRAATQGSQATIALKKFCLTTPAANMNMPGRSLEGIFTECKLAGRRGGCLLLILLLLVVFRRLGG